MLLDELAARARVPEERDADVVATFVLAAGQWADAGLGEAKATLRWLREARTALDRTANSRWASWLDYQILATLVRLGDLAGTVRDVDALLKSPPATPFDLHSLALVASAQRTLGRFDAAERTLDELEKRLAAARAQKSTDLLAGEAARLECLLHAGRAQIEQELGCPDRAVSLVEIAECFARESGDPGAMAEALVRRADLAFAMERFDLVDPAMERALAEHGSQFSAPQRAQIQLYRSLARAELELMDGTLERRAAEELRAAITDSDLTELDHRMAQVCLLDLLLRSGDAQGAQEVAKGLRERLHGTTTDVRALTQLGRVALAAEAAPAERSRALAELEAAYRAFLAAVKRLPLRPGGVGFLHDCRMRQMLGTSIQLACAVDASDGGTTHALELVLEAQAAGTLTRRVDAGEVTLDDVRRELIAPGAGAVVYVPAYDVTHVFAVDQEGILHAEIPASTTALRDELASLRSALLRRGADPIALRELGRRAADRLLPKDIAARIATWTDLTVTGTQIMLDVPFECLVLEDGTMLGLRHAIATLPSLPLGVALARRAAPSVTRDAISMHLYATLAPNAAPEGVKTKGKGLDGAERELDVTEIEKLTGAFARGRTTAVLGTAFTRAALARDDLRDVGILHFIAHGYYDFRAERGSCLLVTAAGDDGVLRWDDIDALHFRGLAVISACGSAVGPARFGDDSPANLGGAFLWGGARAVVLSRTAVNFESSTALLAIFYEQLLQGRAPAEALRAARAQRAADGEDPLLDFQRAPLQVLGLGHAPLVR